MVLVFPDGAERTIRNGRQAEVNVYHDQIDPLETQAIQLFTRTGVDEINQQVLRELVRSGQQESADVEQRLDAAKASVNALDRQLSQGGGAQQELQLARGDLAGLALALGPSLAVLGGIEQTTGPGESAALLEAYRSLTQRSDQLGQSTDAAAIDAQQVGRLSADLETLDEELATFQSLSPEVIVSPFTGSAQRVVEGSIQLVDFYAPAVLALLVQHMVVTFVGLSIVRERELGTNELLRAAPVTTAEMVIGKYLAFAVMGAAIAAALVAGLIYGLGVPMVGSWAVVVTTIGLLLLASTGLGFLLALAAGTDSQAVQYAMLVLLASIFFSGFLLSLERFRQPLTWLARALPVTSGVVLLRDEMLRGQLVQPLNLVLLAGLAVVLFVVAWRLYRRRLFAG
jgi:ABC-2 type transport system permease protein